jgi:hypothetical protein
MCKYILAAVAAAASLGTASVAHANCVWLTPVNWYCPCYWNVFGQYICG